MVPLLKLISRSLFRSFSYTLSLFLCPCHLVPLFIYLPPCSPAAQVITTAQWRVTWRWSWRRSCLLWTRRATTVLQTLRCVAGSAHSFDSWSKGTFWSKTFLFILSVFFTASQAVDKLLLQLCKHLVVINNLHNTQQIFFWENQQLPSFIGQAKTNPTSSCQSICMCTKLFFIFNQFLSA